MSSKFIRVYKKLNVPEIKEHLIIVGDTSASCAKCKSLGLKIDTLKCPECQAEFKYMAFRKVKDHMPKMQRFSEARPELIFVDLDDFERVSNALKAEEFLR